jgi:hypothetical protein
LFVDPQLSQRNAIASGHAILMKMHRAFQIFFLGAWFVSFGSWFPIATVEDRALMRPDHRTDEFSRPLNIKGVVRYVTPTEEVVDDVSTKAFFIGSVACGFAAIGMAIAKRRAPQDEPKTATGSVQQA